MSFTPEQITEILQIYFDNFVSQTYTGMRYVPIIGRRGESSAAWNNSEPYEPLTIVTYSNESYTSRQYVPAGVAITNTDYWVKTGAYNAQIAELQDALPIAQFDSENTVKDYVDELGSFLPASDFDNDNTVKAYIDEVADLLPSSAFDSVNTVRGFVNSSIDNLDIVTPEMFDAVGDGVTDDTQAIQDAFDYAKANKKDFILTKLYKITDTLSFDDWSVNAENAVILVDNGRTKPAIELSGRFIEASFGIIIDIDSWTTSTKVYDQGYHGFTNENYVGIRCKGFAQSVLNVKHLFNFTVGLELYSYLGSSIYNSWNTYNIQSIRNCKTAILFTNDTQGAWNNANVFNDTEIAWQGANTQFMTESIDRYGIRQKIVNYTSTANPSCSSNTFNNFKFEYHKNTAFTPIYVTTMSECVFNNPYCEVTDLANRNIIVFDFDTFPNNGIYELNNKWFNAEHSEPKEIKVQIIPNSQGKNIPSIAKCIDFNTDYLTDICINYLDEEYGQVASNKYIRKNGGFSSYYGHTFSNSFTYFLANANICTSQKINSSLATGTPALFIELTNAANTTLEIITEGTLPALQAYDTNGDKFTVNPIIAGQNYTTFRNDATYYYNTAGSGTHAYLSFNSAVKYIVLLLQSNTNIIHVKSKQDIKVSNYPFNDKYINYQGWKSTEIPTAKTLPPYTKVWNFSDLDDLGSYWLLESDGNGDYAWSLKTS